MTNSSSTYAIHYAANLARAGKTVEFGMWDKRAGSYNRHVGSQNPAQCRDRGARLDYTTNPEKVTCLKCAGPSN